MVDVSVADAPRGTREGLSFLSLTAVGNTTGIQFIADANTPSEYLAYDKHIYHIPIADAATLGSSLVTASHLLGIPGYHIIGGITGHQWLMIDPLPAALSAGILAIPVHGWFVPASLWTYRRIASTLLNQYNVDVTTLIQLLTDIYNAALNELNSEPG